jgi:2-aminobenzoate-CoA ligase
MKTAHKDTFVIDNLPPKDQWPELIFDIPEVQYPEKMNAAVELLKASPERAAIHSLHKTWTFGQVDVDSNKIAHILVNDLGLVPGNRVLLRGPNSSSLAICFLAVLKAGGVAVLTMPMLRKVELNEVMEKARIDLALCDSRMLMELDFTPTATFHNGDLDQAKEFAPPNFDPVETYATDPAQLAFTSGTTGKPKACVHFHRDIMAMADTFSKHILKPEPDEIFAGTPPLSFTFGLGGLLVFPFVAGASVLLNETQGLEALAQEIEAYKITTLFTSPTAYRALLGFADRYDFSSLKTCVSAGEIMPKATSDAWTKATGIRPIDGIGATEMIHVFISASGKDIRPGATGKPVPGYRACVLDERGNDLPKGSTGRLAVKGPTGCRYLDDDRQRDYVRNGWNVTGDIYREDEDGYFWYVSRTDDMIITGGYNVAGPEVENALLTHPAVQECAVVGIPDAARGQIVKAFIVAKDKEQEGPALAKALQDHVKAAIAPYKYPRAVEFVAALPKTRTGKVQRYTLREKETGA